MLLLFIMPHGTIVHHRSCHLFGYQAITQSNADIFTIVCEKSEEKHLMKFYLKFKCLITENSFKVVVCQKAVILLRTQVVEHHQGMVTGWNTAHMVIKLYQISLPTVPLFSTYDWFVFDVLGDISVMCVLKYHL